MSYNTRRQIADYFMSHHGVVEGHRIALAMRDHKLAFIICSNVLDEHSMPSERENGTVTETSYGKNSELWFRAAIRALNQMPADIESIHMFERFKIHVDRYIEAGLKTNGGAEGFRQISRKVISESMEVAARYGDPAWAVEVGKRNDAFSKRAKSLGDKKLIKFAKREGLVEKAIEIARDSGRHKLAAKLAAEAE